MISRIRRLSIGGLLLVLVAALFWQQPSSSAVLYTGVAAIDNGPLRLEVIVDPPVAKPGDTIHLTARVSNRDSGLLTPSISLSLPPGLSGDAYALPAGATFNLQEKRIAWHRALGLPAGLETLGLPGCALHTSVEVVGVARTGTSGLERGYAWLEVPGGVRGTSPWSAQWLVFPRAGTWPPSAITPALLWGW